MNRPGQAIQTHDVRNAFITQTVSLRLQIGRGENQWGGIVSPDLVETGKLSDGTKLTGKGEIAKASKNLTSLEVKWGFVKVVLGNEPLIEGFDQMSEGHDFDPQK